MKDIRTGKEVKLSCYKCDSNEQLLAQETIDKTTYCVIKKEFICLTCAGGPDKVFSDNKDKE